MQGIRVKYLKILRGSQITLYLLIYKYLLNNPLILGLLGRQNGFAHLLFKMFVARSYLDFTYFCILECFHTHTEIVYGTYVHFMALWENT